MADTVAPALDDSTDNWLVYADALQHAGDPRGELISLNAAIADGSSTADRDAYVAKHADALLGDLAKHQAKLTIDWKWCVPIGMTIMLGPKDDAKGLVAELLDSPLAAKLQALRIVAQTPGFERVELGPALAQLAAKLPPSCTELELIDERAKSARMLVSADYDPGPNLVDFGSLDALWAIPQLHKLHLYVADSAQITLGKIEAPELRDFALLGLRWAEAYGGPSSMSESMAAASWPKLERLALRIPETVTYSWPTQYGAYVPVARYEDEPAYEDYLDDEGWSEPVNWSEELGGVLGNLATTSIKQLSLTSFTSGRQLLEAFEAHSLPPTLELLDLSESDLNDDDAAWIAEHAVLFNKLQTLDLSDTLISSVAGLAELEPELIHSSGRGSAYHFAVGME